MEEASTMKMKEMEIGKLNGGKSNKSRFKSHRMRGPSLSRDCNRVRRVS